MYVTLTDYETMRAAIEEFASYLTANGVSEEGIFNSRLVTSELVSNVFQHGGGAALWQGDLYDGRIRILVKSSVYYRPPEKTSCSGVYEESGRGLFLVDSVSEQRVFTGDGAICVFLKAFAPSDDRL